MFHSEYDSDVTVWSPNGRLYQVEYAMQSVKLGTATVGLKNADYAVLIALEKATVNLALPMRKLVYIDDHVGVSTAGVITDGRKLTEYLQMECMTYKYSYDNQYPVKRLMTNLGNKMQISTQRYDRRPYGVGMLVAGFDENGPHIYQVMPSANAMSCKAMAIGSRSQHARKYFERNLEDIADCTMDELICHGIRAIQECIPNEDNGKQEQNAPLMYITVAIVGDNQPFTILNPMECQYYLDLVDVEQNPETPSSSPDDENGHYHHLDNDVNGNGGSSDNDANGYGGPADGGGDGNYGLMDNVASGYGGPTDIDANEYGGPTDNGDVDHLVPKP